MTKDKLLENYEELIWSIIHKVFRDYNINDKEDIAQILRMHLVDKHAEINRLSKNLKNNIYEYVKGVLYTKTVDIIRM